MHMSVYYNQADFEQQQATDMHTYKLGSGLRRQFEVQAKLQDISCQEHVRCGSSCMSNRNGPAACQLLMLLKYLMMKRALCSQLGTCLGL